MKKFLIIFFAVLAQVCAGQPSIIWQKIYNKNNPGYDDSWGICKGDSDTYFIAGISGGLVRKEYILKINKFGDTLWSRSIFEAEIIRIVSSGDNGCVYAIGGYKLVKLNSNGVVVWERIYSEIEDPQQIIKLSDGGYLICGRRSFSGNVAKFDSLGFLEWRRLFPAIQFNRLYTCTEAIDKGYIVSGTKSDSFPEGVIMKLDIQGNLIWETKNGIFSSSQKIITFNDSYLLTGGNIPIYLKKIASNGKLIFSSIISVPYFYGAFWDIKRINNNKYIISSNASNNGASDSSNVRLLIVDTLGNINKEKLLTTYDFSSLKALEVSTNGDIVFYRIYRTKSK